MRARMSRATLCGGELRRSSIFVSMQRMRTPELTAFLDACKAHVEMTSEGIVSHTKFQKGRNLKETKKRSTSYLGYVCLDAWAERSLTAQMVLTLHLSRHTVLE